MGQLLVDEARKEKIGVGTTLASMHLLELRGDTVIFTCPDDFGLDVVRRNKEYLAALSQRILGMRLKFDGKTGDAAPNTSSDRTAAAPPSPSDAPSPQAGDNTMKHPVVQALIREMGARQVDQ